MSEIPPLALALAGAAIALGAIVGYVIAHLRISGRLHGVRIELAGERVLREVETRQKLEREAFVADSEARLRTTFDSLASESLRANNEMFLSLARETLGREHVVAQSALSERETAIAQLVDPLRRQDVERDVVDQVKAPRAVEAEHELARLVLREGGAGEWGAALDEGERGGHAGIISKKLDVHDGSC